MSKLAKLVLTLTLAAFVGIESLEANITYEWSWEPTAPGVHIDVIGTITTDGSVGELLTANILSYDISVVDINDGTLVFNFTSVDSSIDIDILTATESELIFGRGVGDPGGIAQLFNFTTFPDRGSLFFINAQRAFFFPSDGSGTLFGGIAVSGDVFATAVPEPSGGLVALLVCLMPFRRGKRACC